MYSLRSSSRFILFKSSKIPCNFPTRSVSVALKPWLKCSTLRQMARLICGSHAPYDMIQTLLFWGYSSIDLLPEKSHQIVAVKPPQQHQGWVTSLWQLVPFVRSQDFRPGAVIMLWFIWCTTGMTQNCLCCHFLCINCFKFL